MGSIGEVIAAEHFGLTLYGMSKAGHDAFDANGDVQIKLTAGNMFADCVRLIVLRVVSPKQIVYDGPGAPAWKAAGSMQKNGQRKISLTKLRVISERGLDALAAPASDGAPRKRERIAMTTRKRPPSPPSQQRTPRPREIEPRQLFANPGLGKSAGRPPAYRDPAPAPKRPVTLPAFPWRDDGK